ncbi:hypothetical protein WN48_03945 [Eufriesea mexicana]|nr:hypothetical protein WN48_03945 [Eufriesea mexicana]
MHTCGALGTGRIDGAGDFDGIENAGKEMGVGCRVVDLDAEKNLGLSTWNGVDDLNETLSKVDVLRRENWLRGPRVELRSLFQEDEGRTEAQLRPGFGAALETQLNALSAQPVLLVVLLRPRLAIKWVEMIIKLGDAVPIVIKENCLSFCSGPDLAIKWVEMIIKLGDAVPIVIKEIPKLSEPKRCPDNVGQGSRWPVQRVMENKEDEETKRLATIFKRLRSCLKAASDTGAAMAVALGHGTIYGERLLERTRFHLTRESTLRPGGHVA